VQFNNAASAYRGASWDAFIELYRWRDEQPTNPIRSWWTAFPPVDAALRGLESVYPDVVKETSEFRDRNSAFFGLVRNSLINPRLDKIEKIYSTDTEPTAKERRQALQPIPRAQLDEQRPMLEKLLKEMDEAQTSAASKVTAALSKPASTFCKQF
jgi:hypothetical protein